MILFQYVSIVVFAVFAVFCSSCQARSSWWWPQRPKTGECPSLLLLHPCTCDKDNLVLTCKGLDNEERLKEITQVSKNHGIVGVDFESVSLRFIPEDAFQGLPIKIFEIINSGIMALSDTNQAFIGLENSLESFIVENCPYASVWDWYHLSNLTKLDELSVSDSELFEISEDFLRLSQLPITSLRFEDTSLHNIHRTAFSSFKNLKKMFLDYNELTEITRELFPRPAKTLKSLGLSHNNIQAIPEDMFQDMPALEYLHIGANPLYILDEKIFRPIWKSLSLFVFHDAPLICDCRLTWLTKLDNTKKFIIGGCATPERLRGRKISKLKSNELWCSTNTGVNQIVIPNYMEDKL